MIRRVLLQGVTDDCLIPTSRAPITLSTLHIRSVIGGLTRTGFDFGPLLDIVADPPPRELLLNLSKSWIGALALFTASRKQPWSLKFDNCIDALYLRAAGGYEYVIRMAVPDICRELVPAEPYLGHLASLSLPYLELLTMLTRHVTMPALDVLSITHIDPLLRPKVHAQSPAQLRVPKLRVLELVQHQESFDTVNPARRDDVVNLRAWMANDLPTALRQQILFTPATLERLALVGPAFVGAPEEELAAMSALAPRSDVRNWDGPPRMGTLPDFGELYW
ncbi:hypothetical protein EXIGLDRAFT_780345 [Exidia glandulosa HHB12029]|uniref:Uncharacterized protein n=1 Tax=Exidia glandulosa HHB12029 TaxID=1314781 RepID=A0A165BN80_EXIGL|nr:hypothetical protein EXIGLDRAFT_780345 [Exidia glandulosa HHB12029]